MTCDFCGQHCLSHLLTLTHISVMESPHNGSTWRFCSIYCAALFLDAAASGVERVLSQEDMTTERLDWLESHGAVLVVDQATVRN